MKRPRNKNIVNIEERLTWLAENDPRSDEMYTLLKKLAYIYINQNKFLYGYNGVEDVCHDVAADLQMKVIEGKAQVKVWMYYIGQMIKLSYVPNQKELEHEVIDVNGNPVLQDNIRLMSSGAYTSFINDFDTMERNLLLENVGYLISDTMKQIKFKPGSREYNAIYNNVCLNIVRELDGEKPIYFRIEEHIIPFVDVAIEQFKKNFRNSGFMETLYNSVSEDLEMQYIQSDLYKDDYRKHY